MRSPNVEKQIELIYGDQLAGILLAIDSTETYSQHGMQMAGRRVVSPACRH